ncbi:hypothetical protein FRC02_008847 [Tulasnella sp. 418]|nr:hypothetical protein FRC02_008847 [Tulasnella sp. 418]
MKALRHAGIHVTVWQYSDPLDVSEPGQCLMDLPDLRKLKLSFKALCPASWLWMKNLHAPRLEFLAIYLCGPRDQMGSQHWHGEHEQHGWPTLKGVVHSPSLRELSLRLDSGKQCAKCISAFMATVPTVSRMELQLSEWGPRPEPTVPRVLTLECTFPQLENVEVRALRNIMSPENRTLLSSAIARWNPNATVTYVIM